MEEHIQIFDNDKLIRLIKDKFNDDDNELFKNSFQLYNSSYNRPNDYIIDLDDIWKWIGFSRKSDAKKLLITNYKEEKDYTLLLRRPPQQNPIEKNYILDKRGGSNKENIFLTIGCFKKYCLKSATKQADKIYDYYIKMESIIFKYIQEQYNNQQIINIQNIKALEDKEQLLELKDKAIEDKEQLLEINIKALEDNKQLLELKNKEIKEKDNIINNFKSLTYEETEKTGVVYLLSTDKQNITKCGRSKCVLNRIKALQTGCVDKINILHECPTSNDVLLESIVHYILKNYRFNCEREHFYCNTEYMKINIDYKNIK